MKRDQREAALYRRLEQSILVLDGATGTALQDKNLQASDYGGEQFDGCHDYLVLTRPDVIADVHRIYLEAGSDIIETNTFGATPLVLSEYGLEEKVQEINFQAAQIARNEADNFTAKNSGKPRFVAGSMGPTTKSLSVTGGISFDQLMDNYYIQAKALYGGGVDYLLLETCPDTRNIKAGVAAFQKLFSEVREIPFAISGTIEASGSMLAGQGVEALVSSLDHLPLLYIGLNCATGPEFMTDYLREISVRSNCRVACVPNAGLPDEDGNYLETPDMVASIFDRFLQNGWLNLIGGCCGTTPAHIKKMSELVANYSPRKVVKKVISHLSGIEYLEIRDDERPYFVGERSNVIGSRKFKNLIIKEDYQAAAEVARAQVKNGAHIVDICLSNPDRDELTDMNKFLEVVSKMVKVPLMIDSTDEQVIARALTYCQGKSIINSVNLENGEEHFGKLVTIAKTFGAALVVGLIDDDPQQAMGISRERKLAIAKRSYQLLTDKYDLSEADIYWDLLVFPLGTGEANYRASAIETIEGIKLIKAEFPQTKTILGLSNISFGLPLVGREVLNTLFLYHCTNSGLDLAIANTEKIRRYSSLTIEEREKAENLLFCKGDDPLKAFIDFFRDKKVVVQVKKNLPLLERLPQYVIDGSKEGLLNDLDLALKDMVPLDIINGPLMQGMDAVGKLFNKNKLIVAEVLQSAEVMKAAVSHLEPHINQKDKKDKGKILLATVKGDVHDIGKNLVDIILSNNGYDVINLGIKISSDQLISAIREHRPSIVGLSGLLVKSANQMSVSADDLTKSGIDTPLMVGGAALSSKFVDKKIANAYGGTVVYAKDAMDGLTIANKISDPAQFKELQTILREQRKPLIDEEETEPQKRVIRYVRSALVDVIKGPPVPSDYQRHVIKNTPIEMIWKYINPLMLYGRHLGIRGKLVRSLVNVSSRKELEKDERGRKALELWEEVEVIKRKYKDSHFIAKGVYKFFPALSSDNDIIFFDEKKEKDIMKITFPRQNQTDGLALSDYILPQELVANGKSFDSIALFIVTVGQGVIEEAKKLKERGDFLQSHIISALALESAEAYAEYLHSRIRSYWGQEDKIDITMMDRFKAKYMGKRYSFGYPACPNLDDQAKLFELLKPTKDIGVELTESFMMDPESSISALCFHHPQARYYSVGDLTL